MADALDAIWKALSDPTRRAILDELRRGPRTTTQLVERFDAGLTRFGVMKHIEVLRQAGLIHTRRQGRLRINTLNAVPIRRIYDRWVSKYEGYWAQHLIDVKRSVKRRVNKDRDRP